MTNERGCERDGKKYSEGYLLCENGRELKCRGKVWVETGYPCFIPEGNAAGDYVRIQFIEDADETKPIDIHAPLSGCVQWISGAPEKMKRLYNTCDKCKEVAINWHNGTVEYHKVPPRNKLDIFARSGTATKISEQDC